MKRRPVSVIEFAGYRRGASELLTEEEQDAVIDLIAYEPTCGNVMPGTGGLRKVRIGRGGIGRRGGARVVYYFHDVDVPIFLLAIYAKSAKADLKAGEKREFSALVKEIVARWQRK
jgi:mRNA-degrading endonuclease RelE of RelBE toxin-antitoxin system